MKPLNPRQSKVLEFIKAEVERCNYPPSVREIGWALGISSTSTVHAYLEALEERGYIRRDATKPRAIELLPSAMGTMKRCAFVPLVGRITAGRPILAEENLEGYFPLPHQFAEAGSYFVLRVEGDSMSGAGILDGDFAVIRQQETVENGEIAAVRLGDEATIKRFYREKNGFRLQPENENYEPILTVEVEILGKVAALFRKL